MSTPDLTKLGAEVKDLGLLIGLLKGNKTKPDINKTWFADPKQGLTDGFNWPNLKPVVESFMGKPKNPFGKEGTFLKENWYPVSVADEKAKGGTKNSGFYLVEKTAGKVALLGLGMHRQFKYKEAKTTIDPFVFAPIFKMPAVAKAKPLFEPDTDGPIEIGFKLKYAGNFSGLVPYKQLLFWVTFDLAGNTVKPDYLLFNDDQAGEKLPGFTIIEILNIILGLDDVVSYLDEKALPGNEHITFTWADLFMSLGWLVKEKDEYKVGTIDLSGKQILDYVTGLITKAFDEFMEGSHALDIVKQEPEEEGDPSWKMSLVMDEGRYGVNIQVADVVVNSSPEMKLQIGGFTADETDWIEAAGGPAPTSTGLNFYLLSYEKNGISFDPQFEAISVGLDISQPDEQPLFDVKGYSLNQAQLRGYFSSIPKEDEEGNVYSDWGVAAALNGVALPLGPSAESEGVAQTLLASGNAKEEEGDEGDKEEGDKKPGVNPEFSLLTAYFSSFYLQLFDENGEPQNIVSIPLQKSFGPVAVNDVGIGWDSEETKLLFQLSGGLNLSALKLDLDKLTVGVPVTDPGNIDAYTFGLDGFDLSFSSGPVSMAGGFLKEVPEEKEKGKGPEPPEQGARYNGAVAIQAASWGITAMGSFGTIDKKPSLFIFGVLDAALGGPPVFFVTALAAGFGYNRKVVMPAINQVQNFPFVKAAVNPASFAGKDNDKVLAGMSKFIPPELGQYWFAAGVKFSSFEVLNSFALLILQFGKKTEIDLLGLTTLQLPKPTGATKKLKPYVNAQMAIKATFEPEEGILAVQAQLTNNSYVIDPKCKITGGFAYYTWFKGKHADDFVVTLGGYNKNFDKTKHKHYPTVPRLAFDWKVSPSINFSGEAYFALTPSCVMAGGKLSLTYQDGDLQAWFKAVADFLIAWKPFHYDIAIGITVGVSYRVNIAFIHKTITLELGVDVQMWGPEFGGQAEVKLWIISFTVNFGADKELGETTVNWQKFYDYFLTGEDSKPQPQLQSPNADPLPGKKREIITINTNSGLKEKVVVGKEKEKEEIWVVDSGTFVFNTVSVFPVSVINFVNGPGGKGDAPAPIAGKNFGVKPIGNIVLKDYASNFTLGLSVLDGKIFKPYSLKNWKPDTNLQNVPEAMYGTVKDPKEQPAAKLIGGITKGLGAVTPPSTVETGPEKFSAGNMKYSVIAKPLYRLDATAKLREIRLSSDGSLDLIKNSISTTAKTTRDDIFAALGQLGSLAGANADMSLMAAAPENIFQDSPMLANTSAVAQPLQTTGRLVSAERTTLRRNVVLSAGHQLKATIVKYGFGNANQSGIVLRGGLYNTAVSKSRYAMGSALNSFNITPGMLQVWQLDNTGEEERLRHAGQFPVRLVLFDEYLQVITDKILSATGATNEAIPAHASQMCLQGLSKSSAALAGWHEESCLALVNPKYLMGKGCLVRPKISHSVGYKQYIHDTGLVNGRALIMKNSKRDEGEQVGWIETRFLTGIKQVFVLAKPQPDADITNPVFDNEVRLMYYNEAGDKEAMTLTPQLSGANGQELWAGFNVPGVVGDSHFSIWVEVRTTSNMELAGVAGTSAPLNGWTADLSKELKAVDAGLDNSNAKNKLSVGLQNALNF